MCQEVVIFNLKNFKEFASILNYFISYFRIADKLNSLCRQLACKFFIFKSVNLDLKMEKGSFLKDVRE